MSVRYTDRESRLLGRQVRAISYLSYTPSLFIEVGTVGIIVDFGRTSGDPLIDWGEKGKAFAAMNNIELVDEQD